MHKWYAIQTKSSRERIAEENLQRQNFHTFLPLIHNTRHKRGSWQTHAEPLFPGYLFVSLDFDSQNIAPIRSTRGVLGILRFGAAIAEVPTTLVETLQALGVPASQQPEQLFQKNDQIEIIDGPFAGLKGIVNQQTGVERVVVLLELLGRHNAVTVTTHHIVPIAS